MRIKRAKTKAEIGELWDTGDLIIEDISSIEQLRDCANVIVGDKDACGYYEVMVDDNIYHCHIGKRHHPADGSTMYVCYADTYRYYQNTHK